MMDRGIMTETSETPNGNAHPDAAAAATLEQRVRRLEDVVAGIQDTRQLEERIVERVRGERSYAIKDSAGMLVSAGRQLLPAALTLIHPEPSEAVPPPAPSSGLRPSWVVFEAYFEARAMVR